MNGQGIIGIVYNKAGRAAVRLFYVLFLEIVNLNLVVVPAFGIIAGESSCLLKDTPRQVHCQESTALSSTLSSTANCKAFSMLRCAP